MADHITLPNNWTPRPYQLEVFNALQTGIKRAFLLWHRRCLSTDTRVSLAGGGWKYISDIRPGDEVLTWTPERGYVADVVVNKWKTGIKPIVAVQAAGFPQVLSTADHRFMVRTDTKLPDWVEIGAVRPKAKSGSRDKVLIQSVGRLSSTTNGLSVDTASLLGYLTSDGSTTESQQPKFTNNNEPVLRRVMELVSAHGCTPVRRKHNSAFNIGISNGRLGGGEIPNPVKELCREHGILCQKSIKRVPPALFASTEDAICAYLAAVLDSDGSIYLHRNDSRYIQGKKLPPAGDVKIHAGLSKELAYDYQSMLLILGVVSKITLDKTCWTVRVNSIENVVRLLRKVSRFMAHDSKLATTTTLLDLLPSVKNRNTYNGVFTASVSVTQYGVSETWDIETRNHHSFFANGYLVHNSGKDDFALHYTACAAMQRVGNYWHMLPQFNQCRRAIWEAINPRTGKKRIDEAFPDAIRASTRTQDMRIEFINGSSWQLVGSDAYDSLVGAPPVGLVFSEYALADPQAWAYLRPILADNDGFAIMITTPRGKNHAFTLYHHAIEDPSWFASCITASTSGVFSEDSLRREKQELIAEFGDDEGEAIFRQEYLCDFHGSLSGSYFGSIMAQLETDNRLQTSLYNPSLPVSVGWDIGVNDPMAMVFCQNVGSEHRIIDYYETSDGSVQSAAKVLNEKGYVYDTHYMPHDIAVRVWSDNAKTRYETALGLGIKPIVTVDRVKHVGDKAQIIRNLLPQTLIDSKKCAVLINHLRAYRKKWNPVMKIWDNKPEHGPESHGVDALSQYYLGFAPPLKVKPVSDILSARNFRGVW